MEGQIVAQCDAIIQAVNEKKLQLIDEIRQHRDMKKKLLSNQITDNGLKLQQATGFFQFCFEIVKEPDATAFLQVGIFFFIVLFDIACVNAMNTLFCNSA